LKKEEVTDMDDETIKKQVTDILYWDNRIDVSNVKVEVDNKEVKLTGTVPTYRAWRAATNDAMKVINVKSVDNGLTIKYKMLIPKDDEIKEYVRNILFWDPDLSSWKIDVDVDNGKVTLHGIVDAYWKKVLAGQKAENVFGVVDVENKLGIALTEDTTDERIAESIVSAMERSSMVDAENINVAVQEGRVILSGKVPTSYAKDEAYLCALYTPGVRTISNDIEVLM
jgi:osmotically-inducible protein OsmY